VVHTVAEQRDRGHDRRPGALAGHADAIRIDGVVAQEVRPDPLRRVDDRHDVRGERVRPEPAAALAQIVEPGAIGGFDHRNRGVVAEAIAPQVHAVARRQPVAAEPDEQRHRLLIGCVLGHVEAVVQRAFEGDGPRPLVAVGRPRLGHDDEVRDRRAAETGDRRVALRADVHGQHAGAGLAQQELSDRPVPVLAVEATVDVQDHRSGVGVERQRAGLAHGVVPERLGGRQTLVVAAAAPHHREVTAHGIVDTSPVLGRVRMKLRGRVTPLIGIERVDDRQPVLRDPPRERPREVRGDHRAPVGAGPLDHRAIGAAVLPPRPRALEELVFVDRAGKVLVQDGLHIALEHLHGQDDGAVAPFEQTLVDREFHPVRRLVHVGFAEEDGVRPGEVVEHRVEGHDGAGPAVQNGHRAIDRGCGPRWGRGVRVHGL